jgi:hypothetical protein
MIYGLYSLFRTPPPIVNWLAIVGALFLAGYYLWRADHIRLIRQIAVGDVRVIVTPTRNAVTGEPAADQAYVQVGVRCDSDVSIKECSGKLLSVDRWNAVSGEWEPTAFDEPLDLLWSVLNTERCLLEPSAPRRLNLFYVENVAHRWIRIATRGIPFRMEEVFSGASAEDIFKFTLAITGADCPTVIQGVRVQLGTQFGNPMAETVVGQNTGAIPNSAIS